MSGWPEPLLRVPVSTTIANTSITAVDEFLLFRRADNMKASLAEISFGASGVS